MARHGSILARSAVRLVAIALAYWLSARAGLRFAIVNDTVTPVWPPTGIAVAALLMFGPRVWPAIAAGAFAVNAGTVGPGAATSIATGNTLAVVIVATALRRSGFHPSIARLSDAVRLLATAAGGMLVSATVGAGTLLATGAIGTDRLAITWGTWWSGDALGIALVAPAIWAVRLIPRERARRAELLMTLIATGALMAASFATQSPALTIVRLLPLWAAWRFGLAGGAPAALVATAVGILATGAEWEAFRGETFAATMLRVQGFAGMATGGALVVAALGSERKRDRDSLVEAKTALEARVGERTREITVLTERLSEAQRVAALGSFEWTAAGGSEWSQELRRLLHLNGTASSFRTFMERVHPDDRPLLLEAVERSKRTGASYAIDYRIVLPDGEERWVQKRGNVERDAAGAATRIFGTVQDVTGRKLAEQALRSALEREHEATVRQKELAKLKDAMLAAVSHELRTPLTIVLGMASTLKRDEILTDPQTSRELVERLEIQAKRLARLLTDLLDLDRLQRGIVEPRRASTDVAALCRRVVHDVDATTHRISIEGEDVSALIDAAHVERIVENLVRNAIRHTPSGTSVWVRVLRAHATTTIVVEDEGPGVDDSDKAAIFDVFWQKSGTAASAGTGVGLSLVARLADLHGGRAWVADRVGGGAAFYVEIPDADPQGISVVA